MSSAPPGGGGPPNQPPDKNPHNRGGSRGGSETPGPPTYRRRSDCDRCGQPRDFGGCTARTWNACAGRCQYCKTRAHVGRPCPGHESEFRALASEADTRSSRAGTGSSQAYESAQSGQTLHKQSVLDAAYARYKEAESHLIHFAQSINAPLSSSGQ